MLKNDIPGLYPTDFDIIGSLYPLLNCDIYPLGSQSDNCNCIFRLLCILYYTYYPILSGSLFYRVHGSLEPHYLFPNSLVCLDIVRSVSLSVK